MKAIPTVHELRKSGMVVEISHYRQYYRYNPKTGKKKTVLLTYEERAEKYPDFYLDAKGGGTSVAITNKNNEKVSIFVECSNFDAYNRKTGVRIGVGRAYKLLTNSHHSV